MDEHATTVWTHRVDPGRMRLMAALLRDPNPIHFDPVSVRALGLGDRTVNQGPTNMAYVMNGIQAWLAGRGRLQSFTVRFEANVFADDVVTVDVAHVPTRRGSASAELDVRLSTPDRVAISGRAVVVFPHRKERALCLDELTS